MRMIPLAAPKFIKNGLVGKDLHKKEKPLLAESMGTVVLLVYLIILILMLPFELNKEDSVMRYLAAILSIQSMGFLGFIDDVLELKWRHKLFMPLFASLPLIMIYYLQSNATNMILPFIGLIHLGVLYYVYMVLFTIFCTNSINILAGINGLEVGQSIIIQFFIFLYSCIQYWYYSAISHHSGLQANHLFTIAITVPFLGGSLALFHYNRYPAKVFVGDSYTYTSGMICAICGILSHTSKTLILFFVPQILNFLISIPQLLRMIPCPKHRLPRYDPESDLLYYGHVNQDKSLEITDKPHSLMEFITQLRSPNACHLNLVNIFLFVLGPMTESQLLNQICLFQFCCNLVALGIRYGVGYFIFNPN